MPIPILNSLPGAPAAIYLDFAGDASDHATPAYQYPDAIAEIFSRVAEKFSPFNINVTTVEQPAAAGKVQWVLIGGSDWTGKGLGGTANVGSFVNNYGTAYVFPDNLGNDKKTVAEAIAHEIGHTLGLVHHGQWVNGTLVSEYDPGNNLVAPIMGNSYGAERGVWSNGPTSFSPTDLRDDMAFIASDAATFPNNGFGYRPQDHGQNFAHAETLSGSVSGIIGTTNDRDIFRFHSVGGTYTASLSVAVLGPTLHARLELDDFHGSLIAVAGDPGTLDQYLTLNLAPGDYYLAAESFGGYGDVGSYTLTVPEPSMGLIVLGILLKRDRRKH